MSKGPKKGKALPVNKKEAIAQAIAACADKRGEIKPADVVKAALNPDSILHAEFEWNKDVLVQQALERRAAELIRQCRSMISYGERTLRFPTYISNPQTDSAGYASTRAIAKDDDLKAVALEAELARVKSAVHRMIALALVFELETEAGEMLDAVLRFERRFDRRVNDDDPRPLHA